MKAEDVFLAVLERSTSADRKAYLEGVCADDPQLRDQIEGLLRSHEEAGSFLNAPLFDSAATIDHPPLEQPGTQIGPYKLLEQIGEGGMGVVYVASQKEPLRRKVALKIIKPGMDTREVVARFEAERQALAMMDHPNIAKVFDAGATDAGRPYFAMELVKGTPITEYCDRERLSTRERLALFVTLCHGVQHAHQKGVIHRDLKPSNLLIEVDDVRPVPKIIDFGIAKAVGQQLTEKTFHTGFEQMVGTPLYMSPEQAGQSCKDVDTRSDIYSLGVLLYELLTGHTPFEKDTLRTVGVDEMRRIIREVDPPRPSVRVSTLEAADLSTITGAFRPEGNLSVVEGKQAQGTWKLEITDDQKQSTGTLKSWSIDITSAGVSASNFIDTNPTMLGNAGVTAGSQNFYPSRKVVVSDNGDAMAVWLESKGPGDTGPWSAMAAIYVAGSWQTPVVIMDGNPSDTNYGLELVGDGLGNYLAVIEQAIPNAYNHLSASRYVAGSGWLLAEPIAGGNADAPKASMAHDAQGVTRAVVAWGDASSRDAKINHLDNFATGSWSGEEIAESLPSEPGVQSSRIDVAMAQNGDFMLVFSEFAPTTLSPPSDAYYRVHRNATGWEGSEQLLEYGSEAARYPSVVMNSSGVAMVVWRQETGPDKIMETWARRWNGLGWDTGPQKIVDSATGTASSFNSSSRPALNENGEAIVFWAQQRNGSAFSNAYVRHHDGTQWGEIIQLDTEDLGSVGVGGTSVLNSSETNIAMDDAGNAAAVWTQSDGTYINMWASQFTKATSTWSTAQKLENAALDAVLPSVDMSAGVAQVIWTQSDGQLNHMYSTTLPQPTLLDNNPDVQGNVGGPGGLTSNDVAMSEENGDAMALWLESKGPGDTGPFMAMAARYDAATGKWGTPVIVSDPSSDSSVTNWCRIAGDGQGNYLATWQQPPAGSVDGDIWVNRYVAGSGWQTPQTIESDTYQSYDPVVAMAYDPAAGVSKAVVAWGYGGNGKVNRLTDFAANIWSGASLAVNRQVDYLDTKVGMAANGDFLLTLKDGAAPYDLYYRHYDWSTENWTGPESAVESRPEIIASDPSMAMNEAGAAIVSWGQRTGTGGVLQTWARRWNGSDWAGPAELVSDDPVNRAGDLNFVAISDSGEAAVFYSQKRGGTPYYDAYVRRHDGTAWQDIVQVDSEDLGDVGAGISSVCSKGPAGIAMDDSGNIMTVWQQSDGVFTNIWSAKFDHSALSWSPAVKAEQAPWDAIQPVVAVNSSGVTTTIWVQPDNTLTHIYANRTTMPLSAPVAAAATLIGNDAALASLYDEPLKKLRTDTAQRSESRTVEENTRDLSYTVGASASRITGNNRCANDKHHTEVDDLFAQWESDPLELLSFPVLGM